jgi:hypothetical protein
LKRRVLLTAVLLILLLILAVCLALLIGPMMAGKGNGAWHIIDPTTPGIWLYIGATWCGTGRVTEESRLGRLFRL